MRVGWSCTSLVDHRIVAPTMQPIFFRTPDEFRTWLSRHHAAESELLVGFHKRHSGRASLTWPESVDEALCYGWIDGIRRRIDDDSYSIRFTPRRKTSVWSAVNIARVAVLTDEGRMQPAGTVAFEARLAHKSRIYSYEQRDADLGEPWLGLFKKRTAAWRFFEAQAPSYRRLASHWVQSAKKEETRLTRFQKLLAASAEGRRI